MFCIYFENMNLNFKLWFLSLYRQRIFPALYILCYLIYNWLRVWPRASEIKSKKQKPKPSWIMEVAWRLGKASLRSYPFCFFRLDEIKFIFDTELKFMWPAHYRLVVVLMYLCSVFPLRTWFISAWKQIIEKNDIIDYAAVWIVFFLSKYF